MAAGARDASGADLAVSVTGIAGPGGGTPEKPVGTVHIGLAWEGGVVSEQHQFLGGRADVRTRSAQSALALVRRYLLNPDDPQFASGAATQHGRHGAVRMNHFFAMPKYRRVYEKR